MAAWLAVAGLLSVVGTAFGAQSCGTVGMTCSSSRLCCSSAAGQNMFPVDLCCVAEKGSDATDGRCQHSAALSEGQHCLPRGTLLYTNPVFSGFDGSANEFAGQANTHYSILKEANHQITALFSPAGKFNGTYITSFGFQFGGHEIAIHVDQTNGDLLVELNGARMKMAEDQTSMGMHLRNKLQPEVGDLTLTWSHHHPEVGELVELATPLLTFSVWSLSPVTADGRATGDVGLWTLDIHVTLLGPPANNEMSGVLGQTYNRLISYLLTSQAIPNDDHLIEGKEAAAMQATGLFDTHFPSSLFGNFSQHSQKGTAKPMRRLLQGRADGTDADTAVVAVYDKVDDSARSAAQVAVSFPAAAGTR